VSVEDTAPQFETAALITIYTQATGCNFPNCPRTSIYEASERDFRVVVVPDALSGLYDRGAQELVGIDVALMGAEEVVQALRERVAA
jgi:hypothetical protein